LVDDNVSTKYKTRDNSYDQIAGIIRTTIDKKVGNYVVYFPSYKYMNEVYCRFSERYPDINTIIQQSAMSEEERENFLNQFQPDKKEYLVCFGVLGGIFSEGIDLKGDRLIGAIIVGVGLPQISTEQDIIMIFFNQKNGKGFENAYMFPGMNKVLQAAGRVIRSENDTGVVLLLDERFTNYSYRCLFPKHWQHYLTVKTADDLEEKLKYLKENWGLVVGEELSAITLPLKFTGRKGRRLVIEVLKSTYNPSWGGWHRRSEDKLKRFEFTVFRKSINKHISPHMVDHIEFIV
jgi:Rad3-related DNA helicase